MTAPTAEDLAEIARVADVLTRASGDAVNSLRRAAQLYRLGYLKGART